ncbi:glycoside hydrolase family 16 protein [Aegicerativicinus sediminis]
MLDDKIPLKVEELNRTGNKVEAYNLVWADEFEMDGAPDKTKWGFNIGNGSNGWGNNESQYYTDRLANAKIDNGHLVITAKKEAINNFYYSSARMLTKDKFEFTYGKIEIRAKLPYGGGTWPAFWLLGANIDEVGWPKCGEIDIMEHVGNNLNTVQSAIHTPSSFGNTSNLGGQNIDNVSGEFHIYTLEWTNEELIFAVDNNVHYTYKPLEINDKTWPFNEDMFIILNIAMGGNLGGKIDPEFKEAKMLIDYVRVYQK